MRRPKGVTDHEAAPKEWRHTPRITGDYDFDMSILRCRNRDMQGKLARYVCTDHGMYQPITAYRGYSHYSGDD